MPRKPRKPLTKSVVDRARRRAEEAGSGSVWVGDATLPGFGLRAYATGSAVFCLRYRTGDGVQRTFKVGDFPTLTVDEARRLAREHLVEVERGGDPQGDRIKARQVPALGTVGDLLDAWLAEARHYRRSWREDARRIETRLKPAIGRLRVGDLTVDAVKRLHRTISSGAPVEANRVLGLLQTAWRWGWTEERMPEGAMSAEALSAPRRRSRGRVRRNPERSRTRWLRPAELERLGEALEGEEDPHFVAQVRLLLLAPSRMMELLARRWSDVDLEAGELSVPDPKNGVPIVHALSETALEILRELPRVHGSEWIFPSSVDPSRHVAEVSKRKWARLRKRAGLEDVRIHDLRRTPASLLWNAGLPREHIKLVLGHRRERDATDVYTRADIETERRALALLADLLAGPLRLAPPSPPPTPSGDVREALRALLARAADDPERLTAGLRQLAAIDWREAVEA